MAVERRKAQKNKKLRKEQRSHFKTLVQNQLWPILDKIKLVDERSSIHLWVDSIPLSRQHHQSEHEDFEIIHDPPTGDSNSNSKSNRKLVRKGSGTKNKAKGDASPSVNNKALHPRSHGNTIEETSEEDVPLLCHDYFFKGSCPTLVGSGSGSKSKKNHCKCNFEHYTSKKEMTLACAIKSKSKNDIERDEYTSQVLKRASDAAFLMQKRLDGQNVPDDDISSFVDEFSGIEMLYHVEVPLVLSSSMDVDDVKISLGDLNITHQISNAFNRQNIPISSIAYVVYNSELVFDRYDNGIVLTDRGREHVLGKETKEIPTCTSTARFDQTTDHFSFLPSHLLEHILTFLPGAYSIIIPGLNTILNMEIGIRSPFLWKQLLLRESWPEPTSSSTLSYRNAFISHFRVCQQIEALKLSVENILQSDDHGSASIGKSIAVGPLSNDLLTGGQVDDTLVSMWSDTCVLVASKHNCRFHLFDVSYQETSGDCRLREIVNLRIAPVPSSKKIHCTLKQIVMDDDFVLCSFDVDDKSIVTSISKEDLLANSTEESIVPFLTVHDASSLFEIFCDDHFDRESMDLHFRDLLNSRPSVEMFVVVQELVASGNDFFCALLTIGFGIDNELLDTFQGLITLPRAKNQQVIIDFIHLPDILQDFDKLGVCTNYNWKRRSDPVKIVCKNPANGNIFMVNVNKEGVFDTETSLTFDTRVHHDSISPPRHSAHSLWNPSHIVTCILKYGEIIISKFVEGKLFYHSIEGNYDSFISMNQLGDDHLLLTSIGSKIGIRRLERDDGDSQETLKYFHFIIVYLPDMVEVYHSVLFVNNLLTCDISVGNVRNLSIPLIVGERVLCLSTPMLVSAHTRKEELLETTSPKLKMSKKKKSTNSGKKDGFARGMSLRG